ncbi:MAG: substrate-binding domain-containing protein [Bacillota bacterium]
MQGGGSGTGIAALLNDNADIAQAFRAMADEEWDQARERGMEVREVVVARDAVVVCVHPDNPVEVLSLEQLGAIYRGKCATGPRSAAARVR